MRLSKNFVLSEITHSNTAKRLGIKNEPTKDHLKNLQLLIRGVVQPVRDGVGAIRVSSGYRNPTLNEAIGGSSRSQHCKGQAVDIQHWSKGQMDNKKIYDYILDNDIEFDQMINEFDYSWIHISYSDTKNRKQVLEAYKDDNNKTTYRHPSDNIKAL